MKARRHHEVSRVGDLVVAPVIVSIMIIRPWRQTGHYVREWPTGSSRRRQAVVLLRLVLHRLGNRHAEKLATTRELLRAVTIAEEHMIADAMKAFG